MLNTLFKGNIQHFHFLLRHIPTSTHTHTEIHNRTAQGSHQPVKFGLMRHHPGALSATPTLTVSSEGGEARKWVGSCVEHRQHQKCKCGRVHLIRMNDFGMCLNYKSLGRWIELYSRDSLLQKWELSSAGIWMWLFWDGKIKLTYCCWKQYWKKQT